MRHLRSWQSGDGEAESWSLAAAVTRHLLQGEMLSSATIFRFMCTANVSGLRFWQTMLAISGITC